MNKKVITLNQFDSGVGASQKYSAEIARAASAAIREIDNEKMPKTSSVSITIPTTGWRTDNTDQNYPHYYDINAEGVTATDLPVLIISPADEETAKKCIFKDVCKTISGAVRINTKNIPTSVISAELRILAGGT